MGQRLEIAKRLIIACLLLSGITFPECVEVTPFPEVSSEHVEVTAVSQGKPVRGAKVDFYREETMVTASDHRGATMIASELTDATGMTQIRKLVPGRYFVTITFEDATMTEEFLVTERGKSEPVRLDLTALVAPQVTSIPKDLPSGDQLASFHGSVYDPSGAAVPSARIVVLNRTGTQEVVLRAKADTEGHFSRELTEGSYVAFILFQGFRTAIVPLRSRRTARANCK